MLFGENSSWSTNNPDINTENHTDGDQNNENIEKREHIVEPVHQAGDLELGLKDSDRAVDLSFNTQSDHVEEEPKQFLDNLDQQGTLLGNLDEQLINDNDESLKKKNTRKLLSEVIRTDPLVALEIRKRRLERKTVENVPEIHFVGSILYGKSLIKDSTEGAFCRFNIEYGKSMDLLSGSVEGTTQISYCKIDPRENLIFSHPIDIHLAAAGLQGWGSPTITVQSYRLDWYGIRILSGYGFAHLPLIPGSHKIEINLWRPMGSPDQELSAYLLGNTPSLISHEPIYHNAWRDRCRMVTVSVGTLHIQMNVMTRYMREHDIDTK